MAKRKRKSSKKKSGEILVIQSKVKDYIRSNKGFRTSAEFIDALSEEVEILIDNAIDRAETNKRQTVFAGDL